jgi:hypothetical protein
MKVKNNNELNIYGIKTKNGIMISDQPTGDSYRSSSLKNYFINESNPRESFHKLWFWIDAEPQKVEVKQSQSDINHRYVLIDESLESDKFPLTLVRDEIATYDSSEYEWEWNDGYSHLRSLYKLVSDKQLDVMVEVEFKYSQLMELDEIKEFHGFSYPVQKTQWSSDGLMNFTEKNARNQLLDMILFPEPVHHMLPSKLTSEQFYRVIRQHVKENINPMVAEITSDYDFCFTVKKKIKLATAIKHEKETMKSNGRSYKNRKINVSYQKVRNIEVFEMTYSPKGYQGYTPIPEIVGTDTEDLKNKIDTYLEDLMKMINEPLEDCPHCNGIGVVGFEE